MRRANTPIRARCTGTRPSWAGCLGDTVGDAEEHRTEVELPCPFESDDSSPASYVARHSYTACRDTPDPATEKVVSSLAPNHVVMNGCRLPRDERTGSLTSRILALLYRRAWFVTMVLGPHGL
jgi:hypothetical protein